MDGDVEKQLEKVKNAGEERMINEDFRILFGAPTRFGVPGCPFCVPGAGLGDLPPELLAEGKMKASECAREKEAWKQRHCSVSLSL